MSQVRATQAGRTVSPVLTTVSLWGVGSSTLNDTSEQRSGGLHLSRHLSQDLLQSWTHGCTLSNHVRQATALLPLEPVPCDRRDLLGNGRLGSG